MRRSQISIHYQPQHPVSPLNPARMTVDGTVVKSRKVLFGALEIGDNAHMDAKTRLDAAISDMGNVRVWVGTSWSRWWSAYRRRLRLVHVSFLLVLTVHVNAR
jgi:hypothetical protein